MTHMMRAMTHMLRALFHIFRAVCHMSRGCACCTRASRRANSTLLCACCVRACVRARVCACVRACVRVKCRNWCTSRQHDRCEAPDPRMHTFSNPFTHTKRIVPWSCTTHVLPSRSLSTIPPTTTHPPHSYRLPVILPLPPPHCRLSQVRTKNAGYTEMIASLLRSRLSS
jgi:hypothetical protein